MDATTAPSLPTCSAHHEESAPYPIGGYHLCGGCLDSLVAYHDLAEREQGPGPEADRLTIEMLAEVCS